METANNQIIQEKIDQLQEIKNDIIFLNKMKKKLNPNRSIYQEVLRTIHEEISLLEFQRTKIYTESETLLMDNPTLSGNEIAKILDSTNQKSYTPANPPLKDIMDPIKQAQIDSIKGNQKGIASGSESLV